MMHCESIKNFAISIPKGKSLLGIDYGTGKIGLSISDDGLLFAMPYDVINNNKAHSGTEAIADLIKKRDVGGVVIGYPLELSGREGEACKHVAEFMRALEKKIPDNVAWFYQDERLSTRAVRRFLDDSSLSRKKKDSIDDKLAACNILQTTLDLLRSL